MGTQWFYQMMGTEFGPFTGVELVELARQHRITPEDFVRKGGAGDWVPAYRVQGLFEAAEAADSRVSGNSHLAAQARAASGSGPASSAASASGPPDDHRLDATHGAAMAAPQSPTGAPDSTAGARDRTRLPTEDDYADYVTEIRRLPVQDPTQVDWFCICHGEKRGPLSFRRLREMFASGELGPKERVWSSDSPKWHPARDVPGIRSSK